MTTIIRGITNILSNKPLLDLNRMLNQIQGGAMKRIIFLFSMLVMLTFAGNANPSDMGPPVVTDYSFDIAGQHVDAEIGLQTDCFSVDYQYLISACDASPGNYIAANDQELIMVYPDVGKWVNIRTCLSSVFPDVSELLNRTAIERSVLCANLTNYQDANELQIHYTQLGYSLWE